MAIINGKKVEIHVKGGFSERKGIKHFSDIVQITDLNERTRNKIYMAIKNIYDFMEKFIPKCKDIFTNYIYEELFSLTTRDIPCYFDGKYEYKIIYNTIYELLKNDLYTEVFTFIEGVIKDYEYIDKITNYKHKLKKGYIASISTIFKEENVNYRIIDDKITDIVDENQIKSVEETLNNPHDIVSEHFSKAIEQLYVTKDYANSIKESISAVEAMCQVINGGKESLGKALGNLKIGIHPTIKIAFEKLYGYTSDANGIRHSNGLGEGNPTFEEAKYMLISCSAFVNYLKENFESKEK